MAHNKLKAEFDAWAKANDDLDIRLDEINAEDSQMVFLIGPGDWGFSVTYPDEYPNTTERFFVYTEVSSLSAWSAYLNEKVCEKYASSRPPVSLADLLTAAWNQFEEVDFENASSDEEGDDDYGMDDDYDISFSETSSKSDKKKSKEEREAEDLVLAIEQKQMNNGFLKIGSQAATLRLLTDLKNLTRSGVHDLGFKAYPVTDAVTGKENLYSWRVHLFGFDPKSAIGTDIAQLKKKGAGDDVELEMKFTAQYPNKPPFVRVVKPRFVFHTGHVTIGGSICMELLTNSGWKPTNDIESIIIQIRVELMSGGARIDFGSGDNFEYSEREAWDAFHRSARTHGWDVTGWGPNMFPTS